MFHAMFGFGISWTDGSSSEKGEKTAIVLLPFRRRGQWTDGRRRRIESARGQQLLRRNALQFVRRSVVRPSVRGAGASEEGREIVANFAAVTIASRYAPFPSSSFHPGSVSPSTLGLS